MTRFARMTLVIALLAAVTPLLAGPPAKQVFQAADRARSQNNLKNIGIAMYEYHDNHKTFPANAIYSKDGKPLLSWRVAILPYIEENELYKQFKLDEPWDSESNKKLLEKMPKLYAPVGGVQTKEKHATFYQAFVGKGAAFESDKGQKLPEFIDGTSNTILVIEAGEAVPWTKPDDLTYDADKPLPKVGGLFGGDFNFVKADGAAVFVKKTVDEKTLRAIITRNGGETVDINKLP